MGKVLDTLLSATVGQAAIATILMVGTLGLLFTGREVPLWLVSLDTAVVTFYFTSAIADGARDRS